MGCYATIGARLSDGTLRARLGDSVESHAPRGLFKPSNLPYCDAEKREVDARVKGPPPSS